MRRKILFIPKWYPTDKEPTKGIFVHHHAKAVHLFDDVVVLFIQPSDTKSIIIEKKDGITIIRSCYISGGPSAWFKYFTAAQAGVNYYIKQYGKPELSHAHILTRTGLVALWLKLTRKVPFIITEHWTGYMPEDGRFKGALKKAISSRILRNASAVTTVSQNLKTCMISHGLHNQNYVVIPNVVTVNNNVLFQVIKNNRLIMVCDLIDEMKNISGVISEVNDLIKEGVDISLLVIGDGPDRRSLETLSERNITFTGELQHERVLEEISKSTALVVNSNFETFSVVAAEALSCGVPVITTRCGGPEEFISSSFGIVIEKNKPGKLKEAILKILEKKFDREMLKEYAKQNFSPLVVGKKFNELYTACLKGSGRHS